MTIKDLGKTVLLLGFVSLLNDLSSEMILPILPLFIASLGGSVIAIGFIGGIADSLTSLLKVFSGHWADKIGRKKPFVFTGYALSSISKLFYVFAGNWLIILLIRISDRIGKGIRTSPRDGLIAESTKKEIRGAAFGFHRAMDSLGAVIGTIIVLILFWFFKFNFQSIFLVAGIIGFFALIPLLLIKEKNIQPKKTSLIYSIKNITPELKKFLFASTVFYLGNFSYMFFIFKTQTTIENPIINPTITVLLLYLLFNIVYSVFSYPAGKFSDKFGRKNSILLAYFFFGLTVFGFMLFNSIYAFIILFAVYGLFFAFIEGNEKAFAADLMQENQKSTGIGLFQTVTGIMLLFSSIIAGFLWEFISVQATFLFAITTTSIAIIILKTK